MTIPDYQWANGEILGAPTDPGGADSPAASPRRAPTNYLGARARRAKTDPSWQSLDEDTKDLLVANDLHDADWLAEHRADQ